MDYDYGHIASIHVADALIKQLREEITPELIYNTLKPIYERYPTFNKELCGAFANEIRKLLNPKP